MLELHRLGVQPGDAGAESVQVAAVALHAVAEAGDHRAQIAQRAAPGGDGRALSGEGLVQPRERSPQALLPVIRRSAPAGATGTE